MGRLSDVLGVVLQVGLVTTVLYVILHTVFVIWKIPGLLMDLDETLRGISARQDRLLRVVKDTRQVEEEQTAK